jgi:hypothetical protein
MLFNGAVSKGMMLKDSPKAMMRMREAKKKKKKKILRIK